MSMAVVVDTHGIDARIRACKGKANQVEFAKRVAETMRKYVPLDEGALQSSEPVSSNYKAGDITWNTPYAKRVYNLDSVRTAKNPSAKPQWAEHAKQAHMGEFVDYAKALLEGRGGGGA